MFQKLKKSLSAILLNLLIIEANATQIVENADQGHVQVNISANEQNRLAITGRRIANVVPSRKGLLSVVKDEALGALYFTLANDSENQGSVTLFVSDDQGVTYKLILVPQPVAGEEIILSPPKNKSMSSSRFSAADGHATSYQRRIKNLMLVMIDGERSDSIVLNQVVPLWKESHMLLITKFMDDDLVGEKYHLSNVSPSDMLLAEQEFYRPGVLAVAVEHHTLKPGDATDIFIVRARKLHE